MKAGIHPEYTLTKIVCVCGNTFETRSTISKGEMHVEICAECHPFFTGKQKLVDKAGRVERFRRRYEKAGTKKSADKAAKAKEAEPEEAASKSASS